jgi:hypothetical protein
MNIMEANLLSEIGDAKPRELTADELDLVSGARIKIVLPFVTIQVNDSGSADAWFAGGRNMIFGEACGDDPQPC